MPIDWDSQTREEFDRLVEALVTRWYPSSDAVVRVINGRGGDSGRDIEVVQGRWRRVFQLKHFPEGFSSTWKRRRRQITKSMDAVVAEPPDEWILAVPCTLTDSEREFIEHEATKRGLNTGPVLDRARLESSLAQHEDLVSYFNRGPELREDAKIFNRERDALLGGTRDLSRRVQDLGGVVDAQDPHWTVDFARRGNTTVCTLRPKRANSAEVSPITASLELEFGAEHGELAEQWTTGMNYGLTKSISLPPEVVRRWTVDGPEWIRADLTNVALELRPAGHAHVSRPVELRFLDEDGSTRSSFAAMSTDAHQGAAGATLQLRVTPALELSLVVPVNLEEPGKVNLKFEAAGKTPRDVLDAVDLLRELHRPSTMEVRVGEKRLASARMAGRSVTRAELDELEAVVELADDLEIVGRETRQRIPYPTSISDSDRVTLRALRLAIEGECTLVSEPRGFWATLSDADHTHLRPIIERPACLKIASETVNIELLGRTLSVSGYNVYHPQMEVENADEVLAAIDAGTAAGMKVKFQPPAGQWLRMYIEGRPAAGKPLVPTPWGLPGLESVFARAAGNSPDERHP